MLPKGFAGQTYVVLTTCKEGVSDDTTAAGPAIIEVCLFQVWLFAFNLY